MARSKSSKRWLKEHFDDEFVRRSQVEGYRSRAVYKLKEIDEKDKLIKPGMTIIDLGAAPFPFALEGPHPLVSHGGSGGSLVDGGYLRGDHYGRVGADPGPGHHCASARGHCLRRRGGDYHDCSL